MILFHAGVPGFSGGFVGVDVFFVISGYLIGGILLRELATGEFSLLAFYERRMRRILPALFLMLLACLPFGWWLMSPYAFARMGESIVAVAVFASNVLFWRTTNYFTATMETPLLHTWSLGVEEQFYVAFPLVLWLVWRYARRWLWLSMVAAILVSLSASQWGVQSGRVIAAFYLSPSRAYELLLGALVAYAASRHQPSVMPSRLGSILAWTGLGAIVWAVSLFDRGTLFPGWNALLPSVGTALVLAFAQQQSTLGRLLSQRLMVGIGLISYSAYLWHQPVFAFAHIAGWHPGLAESGALVLAILGVAWLSWRYVEAPFRDRLRISRWAIFFFAGMGSLVFLAVGAAIMATHGASGRFTEHQMRWWSYADVARQSSYVIKRFDGHGGAFTTGPHRRILILGDSYAQDFFNMAAESGVWQHDQIRTAYIPAVCQPVYVSQDISPHIAPMDRALCADFATIGSAMPLIGQADIVILAARWRPWSAELLPDTIANMHLRPDQRLFVVGPKDYGYINVRRLMSQEPADRAALRHQVQGEVSGVNRILQDSLPPEVFINQIQIVCGRREQCLLVTDQDELISYDGSHLTRAGAKYIGQRLFSESVLAEVR